jgi:hypothetical protein
VVPGSVDAIIVPTARPSSHLREANRLAQKLDCHLLVLCSKRASAVKALVQADAGVPMTAIDISSHLRHPLFSPATSAVVEAQVGRRTDTSLKRNLGLVLARMAGWSRVVFLDDDIEIPDADDLRRAAALLKTYDAVGLDVKGMPDNSVVCHARREVGLYQGTFVGGGALAVAVDRHLSFFPDIYNEDWFFLLNGACMRRVAIMGTAHQTVFDPFEYPRRAWPEEFGDVLAEGVFALLDQRRRVKDATVEFWAEFLRSRRTMIRSMAGMIAEGVPPDRQEPVRAALDAATQRLGSITAELCVRYLRAWSRDRAQWAAAYASLPVIEDVNVAAEILGLSPRTTRIASNERLERPPSDAIRLEVSTGSMPMPLPAKV